MKKTMKVVIIGGGIYGLTAALELRMRGHEVEVVDKGPVPHPHAASSDISKLVRPDYGSDVHYTRMMEEALPGWRRWNEESGKTLFHETGVLMLGSGEFERSSYELLSERGHRPERLGRDDIRARFPAWNADRYRDGYFHASGGWVESSETVRWLAGRAREEGVRFTYAEACRVLYEGADGAASGVETVGGGRAGCGADTVVVAAGARTPTLLPHLAPLMRACGQAVFHFRVPPPLVPLFSKPLFPGYAADVQRTGFYGFPVHPGERVPGGGDGRVLKMGHHGAGHPLPVGTTDAEVQARLRAVHAAEERKFRTQLERAWPALRGAEAVFSRMCLYCDTLDTDFLIDHDPARPGLVVAAGGSGHGLKFAPLLGAMVADAVERKPNPHASRFAWRTADEARRRAGENPGDAARQVPSLPASSL